MKAQPGFVMVALIYFCRLIYKSLLRSKGRDALITGHFADISLNI